MISSSLPPTAISQFEIPQSAERFNLNRRGREIRGYRWRHSSPRAVLILVHGLQSHSVWFAEFAGLLLQRGMSVYALDRSGSGTSPLPRGDVTDYKDWFHELAAVVEQARLENPGAPIHVVGHCFGALIVSGCALAHSPEIASLILLTPAFHVLPDYSLGTKLRILLCGLLRPRALFPTPQKDDLFTRDPKVLAWIEGDKLGAKNLTARCLLQIRKMNRWLRDNVHRLDLPVLVFEASRDRISDNQGNRLFLHRAMSGRCRFAAFDSEHLLIAEPCLTALVAQVSVWVRSCEASAC